MRQARSLTQKVEGHLTLVVLPLLDIFEVVYSGIVVVLARKDDSIDIPRVRIGDGMTLESALVTE